MKLRNGFVSNSSSTSFIVIGEPPKKIKSIEISSTVAKTILKDLKVSPPQTPSKYYLTAFSYDYCPPGENVHAYLYGSISGEAMDEQGFIEVADDIYIEHKHFYPTISKFENEVAAVAKKWRIGKYKIVYDDEAKC